MWYGQDHDDVGGLPPIALVTPNLNGGKYLATAMGSVLGQDYPNLQYVVIDGGSSDRSIDIIQAHASRLHHWRSGPDGGLYDAIEIGFGETDAEIMGWINADDALLPWTLRTVGRIFQQCPEVRWITSETPFVINGEGLPVNVSRLPGICAPGFHAGENIHTPGRMCSNFIQQEGTFWRRSLWDAVGGFDKTVRLAADFALWSAFFDHAPVHTLKAPLAAFRRHDDNQISVANQEAYIAECWEILRRRGLPPFDESAFLGRLFRSVGIHIAELPAVDHGINHVRWSFQEKRYLAHTGNVTQY